MSIELILVMFLIGFLGSFLSGMVGIGGSIVKYPMLLYLPPLFGVATYTAQEVSALAMVQVFFATLGGVWAYRKSDLIEQTIGPGYGDQHRDRESHRCLRFQIYPW